MSGYLGKFSGRNVPHHISQEAQELLKDFSRKTTEELKGGKKVEINDFTRAVLENLYQVAAKPDATYDQLIGFVREQHQLFRTESRRINNKAQAEMLGQIAFETTALLYKAMMGLQKKMACMKWCSLPLMLWLKAHVGAKGPR